MEITATTTTDNLNSAEAMEFKRELWIMLKRHGLAYLTMFAFAYYFYQKSEKLEERIESTKNEILNYYKVDNAQMRLVIDRNNQLFEAFLKKPSN